MKRWVLYHLLLAVGFTATAQKSAVHDAAQVENRKKLWSALLTSSADTSRINIQLQLANAYIYLPGDTTLTLLDNAAHLSTSLGYATGLIKALQIRGTFYETTSLDYGRALGYYRQ